MTIKKILVVNDQALDYKVIASYLELYDEGYEVIRAVNGKEACEIAIKDNPSLIIMDWDMPVMDGIEATKVIKSGESTKDIPIIMLTAVNRSTDNLKTAFKAGAIDFVRHPIDKIEFLTRVKSILQLSEYYNQKVIAEQKAKKSQIDLEISNNAKDKFFSIISHDFKNSLNALTGLSGVLANNFDQFDNKQLRENIQLLHETLYNEYELMQNLLQWSRAQIGQISYKPRIIDIRPIIDTVIMLMNNEIYKKGIDIVMEIPDTTTAFADSNMVTIIIRNLLHNAIKFTKKTGSVRFSVQESDEKIIISVSDTGIGIPIEKQHKLFDLKENITTLGTSEERGTGLGLILCKELVEKCKGNMNFISTEGKGSTFSFSLPKN